jgi:hypothetical protein
LFLTLPTILPTGQIFSDASGLGLSSATRSSSVSEGIYRVTHALGDYFKSYAKRGKGVSAALSAANLHIRPALGAVPVAKLTTRRLRDWHHAIADKPRQARGKHGEPGRDAIRKR